MTPFISQAIAWPGTRSRSRAHRRGLSPAAMVVVVVGLLSGGMPPAEAAVSQLPPVRPAHGAFLDVQIAVLTSSLAVDAAGGTHVAVNRWVSDFSGQRGTYAWCPPATSCGSPASWAQVHLVPNVFRLMAPAQLRLTAAGQPRILFTVGAPDDLTTYRYAACDSGCANPAGWTVLDLGSVFNKPGDFSGVYRERSFALDPQGRPRFVYSFQDISGVGRLYYASCDTGCASNIANWTRTTVSHGTGAFEPSDLASIHYSSLALDFTAAGQPRVAGYSFELPFFGSPVEAIAYLACDSACSAPEPVPPATPNWAVTAVAEKLGYGLVLALDGNDAPHMMVAGSEDLFSDLRWLWCAGACTTQAGWSVAPVGIWGSDADLVFDPDNRPHVVFKGDPSGPDLGYAWCTTGCDAPGAAWNVQEADDNQAFTANLPLPGSPCDAGAWLVGYSPSLALDGAGNLRATFTGEHVYNDCNGNLEVNGVNVRVVRFSFFPRPADFDGNATTDVSVFRPSTGQWFRQGQSTVSFGLSSDIPVPADYDASGSTDVAVFRPSVGGWYRDGAPTTFFGLNGDTPVPGDYDGNGSADLTVFRPAFGGWYRSGAPTTFFGLNGDIPVPGDYNGDHITDIAVFRPAVGGWYRSGAPTTFFGLNGDIPVPGDYDGDGTTDIAVFRPAVGGWFVPGQSPVFLGLTGDIPVPGDYDGDGTTDIAVFRPSSGQWFRVGQIPVSFGTGGDVPLPLPSAIRRAHFP